MCLNSAKHMHSSEHEKTNTEYFCNMYFCLIKNTLASLEHQPLYDALSFIARCLRDDGLIRVTVSYLELCMHTRPVICIRPAIALVKELRLPPKQIFPPLPKPPKPKPPSKPSTARGRGTHPLPLRPPVFFIIFISERSQHFPKIQKICSEIK